MSHTRREIYVCGSFYLEKGSEMVADKHIEAEKDYMSGMKYKDIADKYGVTINTVKSWKKRHDWDRKKGAHKNEKRVHTKKEGAPPRKVQGIDEEIDIPLSDELTPEQQMFCMFFVKSFNATQSYIKAYKCKYETAMVNGSRMLRNAKVQEEIQRLKKIKQQQVSCSIDDLIDMNMRIAFADISDYLSFGQEEVQVMGAFGPVTVKDEETGEQRPVTRIVNVVNLNESDYVDTQLIQEVKEGKNGVSIKLADRNKAMDWLVKFFTLNPMDKHKMEFDRQKAELELLKLEMQAKADGNTENEVEDNFLDALNATAKDVWSDE